MTNLYPIAFNFPPLSIGRHCRNEDIDKVEMLERYLNFEDRHRSAKIGAFSRSGYKALNFVRQCLCADPNRRYGLVSEKILQRYHTTLEQQLPALQLMVESGLIQLIKGDDGQFIICNTVKPLTGSKATPFATELTIESMRATDIPEGMILCAEVMIVFGNHTGRNFGEYAHFANTIPGEDGIYLTLDFVFRSGPYAGQFVSEDFRIGTVGELPSLDASHPAFRQIENSALNLFPWDKSSEANESREFLSGEVEGPFWSLQEHYVVVEVGKSAAKAGRNFLRRIIEPDHPSYMAVMDQFPGINAGTGVFGDNQPVPLLKSTSTNRHFEFNA